MYEHLNFALEFNPLQHNLIVQNQKFLISDSPKYMDAVEFASYLPPVEASTIELSLSSPRPRRSEQPVNVNLISTTYQDEVFNSSLQTTGQSHEHQILAYQADLGTNYNTGIFNGNDPRDYAAGNKLNNPDQLSLHKALHGEEYHHYITAMKLEISQLLTHKLWKRIDKKDVPKDKDGKPRRILR